MPKKLPEIGAKEGQHMEFKRADVIRTTEGRREVLRDIVAMRNVEGPTPSVIVIGAQEADGNLIGFDFLQESDNNHIQALRNQIIDSIEPVPQSGPKSPVQLEQVTLSTGFVLLIKIIGRAKGELPSCVRDRQRREFLVRFEERNRLLGLEELFGMSNPDNSKVRSQEAVVAIKSAHQQWIREHHAMAGFCLTVMPVGYAGEDEGIPSQWMPIVQQPTPEIARPLGWTFYDGTGQTVRIRKRKLEAGVFDQASSKVWRHLNIDEKGALQFYTDLESLVWAPQMSDRAKNVFKHEKYQVGPICLAETAVSIFRLAGSLYDDTADRISAVASIIGASEWILPKGTPGHGFDFRGTRSDFVEFTSTETQTRHLFRNKSELKTAAQWDAFAYAILKDLYESDPEAGEVKDGDIPWFNLLRQFVPPKG